MIKTIKTRYQILDFTRGIAIGLMFIYHLSFGLAELGFFQIQFSTDLLWNGFRTLIVFMFLSLVGIGLFLANRSQLNWPSYFKRLALLLVYFSLITLLSYYVRPNFYVFFGILHLIFISSILGLLFVRFYWFNLFLGLVIFLTGKFSGFDLFDSRESLWLGLNSITPLTDDYAPIIPWFGLVLVGIFIGRLLFGEKQSLALTAWKANNWLSKLLVWSGRYSIHLYFIHFQMFYLLVLIFS